MKLYEKLFILVTNKELKKPSVTLGQDCLVSSLWSQSAEIIIIIISTDITSSNLI